MGKTFPFSKNGIKIFLFRTAGMSHIFTETHLLLSRKGMRLPAKPPKKGRKARKSSEFFIISHGGNISKT